LILPTKHIRTSHSLLGVGAALLPMLDRPQTVTQLWERARSDSRVATFERFVLTLDFLYAIGCVDMSEGLLRRTSP
jgi:hypothetical protein